MRDFKRTEAIGWEQESKERRKRNRDTSIARLEEAGVAFEAKNGGAHVIVCHAGLVVDFWPGTGKYIVRGGGRGRGVFNLLAGLGIKAKREAADNE